MHIVDGDHDWMDPVGGYASVENLRQAGNGQGRMVCPMIFQIGEAALILFSTIVYHIERRPSWQVFLHIETALVTN